MKSIYVKTFGCSANVAESEMMAGMLNEAGNRIVNNENESDVILVNVCTVKGENKALNELRKLHVANPGKKIVVGGCVTRSMLPKIGQLMPEASIINTDNIKGIVDVVASGQVLQILDRKDEIKIRLPKIRTNKIVSIIPISQGCTSFCTYCSTKLVKGNIFSYPLEKILLEAKESIAEGCKEIWLTSQDNGDYGFEWDKKSHLPELMRRISDIKGDFMIRVGMTNPIGVMGVADELVDAFAHEKVYKFVHIPVQAGSNEILRRMARRYTADDFKLLVSKFRTAIPEMTIATDIICGFPGETRKQFQETLDLLQETRPDVVNISRFVARDGTAAFRMGDQIQGNEKKDRTTELAGLFWRIAQENNKKWVGWRGNVLIDEIGKHGEIIGRNYAYKPVIIKQHNGQKIGDEVNVHIVDATKFDLRAEIVDKAQ